MSILDINQKKMFKELQNHIRCFRTSHMKNTKNVSLRFQSCWWLINNIWKCEWSLELEQHYEKWVYCIQYTGLTRKVKKLRDVLLPTPNIGTKWLIYWQLRLKNQQNSEIPDGFVNYFQISLCNKRINFANSSVFFVHYHHNNSMFVTSNLSWYCAINFV